MSRVTIESLYDDFTVPRTEAREYGVNYELYAKLAEIEVVPRKMVEMIIAECNLQISDFHHNPSIVNTATHIKEYTQSLLKQFEEDINE